MVRLSLLTILATSSQAIIVRPPSGRYGVFSSAVELIDHSRNDPFAAAMGIEEPRRLMLSSFYPACYIEDCEEYIEQYMPSATAAVYDLTYDPLGLPSGIFGSFQLSFCRHGRSHNDTLDNTSFPIVLFSPGLGNSRLIYSAMAQSFASHGHIVVTIDHPYDASIVEYPDGSYILAANISTEKQIIFDLQVRRHDVSFVIDQLYSSSTWKRLFGSAADELKINRDQRFLMYGHSLGGATAFATMIYDKRIIGAVDLDGSLFGPTFAHEIECPIMFFAHQGKNLSTDPTWQRVWRKTMQTTKVELQLEGSTEGTFTDFPLLAEAAGIPIGDVAELIGTVPGSRVDEILNAYLGDFFDFSLGLSSDPVQRSNALPREVNILEEVNKGNCLDGRKRCV